MSEFIFDTEQGEWHPHPFAKGAMVRPLITQEQNPGLTIARVRLLPGAELPAHTHADSTETFFILSGVALCRVGDQVVEMRPGQIGYAPPGVEHAVRNPGDEPVEALSIFNPPLARS